MIKPIILSKQENSPEVILDKENSIFKISGRSIVENAHQFYKPILQWFVEYFKDPNTYTELSINLDYINSSSSLFLMKIILLFEQNDAKNDLKVIWAYDVEDELLKERGFEIKNTTNINFELKEYESGEYEDFDFSF